MARRKDYQDKFDNFKEYKLRIFFNEPLIPTQELFLYWLRMYSFIFEAKGDRDYKLLIDKVLEDDVCIDAYLVFCTERRKESLKKQELEESKIRAGNDLHGSTSGMNMTTIEYE